MSACMFAMALSCQREDAGSYCSDNQEQTFTFTIAQDEADTKAGYNSDDKIVWKSGDKILVHGAGSSSSYRQVVELSSSNISSDGLTATVKVPSSLKPYDRSDRGYVSKYYAQYPADAAPEGNLYFFSVFNTTNCIMRAGCDDGNKKFTFYDVSGAVSFKVSGDFDSYAFYGNNSEKIGYKHYMARYVKTKDGYVNDFPYTGDDLGGTGEAVKKIYNDHLTCDGATRNYVHIPDNISFDKGVSIDFYKNDKVVATYKRTSAIEVKRGKVRNLGDITSKLVKEGEGGEEPPHLDPGRLARIGQIPVVEVYYTEYTSSKLFPSVEEARLFTHVNVGHARFVNKKTGDGGITIADTDLLRRWVAIKKDYPELKVKVMIGGWGKAADGFSQMARDKKKRKLFVDECVRICREYGVDGFDIDWEYPTHAAKSGDYVNGASPDDWENFVTLFKELREAMPDKILSYAASDSGKYTDNFGVLPYIDYINVMTYSNGNPPYHNASLYRSSITKSRSCAEAIDDIFHKGQNIPYDMMNFGVAFYGHGDGYDKSSGNVYPSTVDYSKLEDIFFKGKCDGYDVSGKNYRVWDDVAKVPYLADSKGKMYASYEDIESVNAKVEYLKSRGMLGAMIWEYRHDDAKGTLRKATRHAMDGHPDAPGRLERPDNYR